MIRTAEEWLRVCGPVAIPFYIERDPFTTAAGLPANQKINLDKADDYSEFFIKSVEAIGDWAVLNGITVLTAVPSGANRFAYGAAQHRKLPFVAYKKQSGGFVFDWDLPGGRDAILAGEGTVGIIEDVTSTRSSMLKLSKVICDRAVRGLAIVDRGQDVPGVTTYEQTRVYSTSHRDQPPAHLAVPFMVKTLIDYPLALWADRLL